MNSFSLNYIIIVLLFPIISYGNESIIINEIVASNNSFMDDFDESNDWIELYNNGTDPVDLNNYFISDDLDDPSKWQLLESFSGEFVLNAGEYVIFWADNQPEQGSFHLGFTLKKSGESVILSSEDLTSSCQLTYPSLLADVSYGYDIASDSYVFYQTPTPESANALTTYEGITPFVEYDISGGLFSDSFSLTLFSSLAGVEIRYSLDNSEPTENSSLYTTAIIIDETTNVKTKAFKTGYITNVSSSQSYIFDSNFNLNIVSISGDEGEINNIFQNVNNNVEVPINFSYFEADGSLLFSQNLGVKIHAPDNASQKSMRFYARSEYGENNIDYPLFSQRNYEGYKRIILRNGGNDQINLGKTLLRDVLGTSMFGELDDEYGWSAFVPVHAFVNGDYRGIYNMRERQDVHWLKQNYGYEASEVDFLERVAEGSTYSVFAGDWNDYNTMEQTAIDLDLSDDDNYAIIDNWINIDNFIDYQFSEILYGNQDWLSNNLKLWKPHDNSRKWEWIIWDVDYGLGKFYPNYEIGFPDYNYLNMALTWGGWGTQIETHLLANLVDNQEFVTSFSSRGADLMNSIFRPDNTQARIDNMSSTLSPDIQRHFDRWSGNNMTLWNDQVTWLGDFLDQRPDYVRQHFATIFELGEIYPINLSATPTTGGSIEVNTIITDNIPWTGLYYEDIPVRIKAIPNPGFTFVEWEETGETNIELFVDMAGEQTYTAIFETAGDVPQLVINEIYYLGNSSNSNDWVEIYNATDETVDISNFTLSDLNANSYVFPLGSEIAANSYIIVANDSLAFSNNYPLVSSSIVYNSNSAYGLNNTEDGLVFRMENMLVIDSVHFYNNSSSWPSTLTSQSIQLESFNLNNNIGSNWYVSSETFETPGEENLFYDNTLVEDLSASIHIGVYPNPFDNEISLIYDNKNKEDVSIKLFDPVGKEVYDFGWITGGERQILSARLNHLSAGTYFIRIQNEKFSFSKPIIKD